MRGTRLLAVAVALALAAAAAWIKMDPRVVFLSPARGAVWIRAGVSKDLAPEDAVDGPTTFRTRFETTQSQSSVALTLGALRSAQARVDGRPAGEPVFVESRAWKSPARVELGPLAAGPHELQIDVVDPMGPAALEAYCENPPIASGESWEVRVGTGPWAAARGLDRPWDHPILHAFPSAGAGLLRSLPALLPVFLLVFAAAWRRKASSLVPSPSTLRWILLVLWAILGLNDLRRLPTYVGFDALAHVRYLQTIALERRLPSPNEGWQTFQAPLYYILSAPLWNALSALAGFRLARFWIRVLPLLCGAVQIEAAYRCARTVFSSRLDLQRLVLLVAGLMPMNLYISQAVGNEPLAGALGAVAVALTLSFRPGPRERRDLAALGTTLGLALLSKASALVVVPPVLGLVGLRLWRRGRAVEVSLAAMCAAAVSGWYYAGNALRYGTPIPSMFAEAFVWWQEPGYRTPAQLLRFGAALTHPIYAGVNGLWDSLYSTLWMDGYLSGVADPRIAPPWNYAFMFACGLFALVPTLAIAAGFWRLSARPRDDRDESLRFCGAVVGLYVAAIVYVYLRLPIYSAGKASYMLGATPCLALLAASGFDALSSRRAVRAALYAALACWAVSAYAAYFVLGPLVPLGG